MYPCRTTWNFRKLPNTCGKCYSTYSQTRCFRLTAWTLTAIVLAITALVGKAAVWSATASADFIASLAEFHRPETAEPGRVILLAAMAYLGISFSRSAGLAVRHLVSTTLHRRARRWLVGRFDDEILADQRIAFDLMSDRGTDGKDGRLPDSIDQRLDTCTDHLYGGLIGLVMGFFQAVASIWFVSVALVAAAVEEELPAPPSDEPPTTPTENSGETE